jgi:hydrogenase maturation protease
MVPPHLIIPMNNHSCLVLGIGNLLLGDEGIGIHVAHRLQKMNLPPSIEILDGGTGGYELLSLCHNKKKIIIVDAMVANAEPGYVIRASPEELDLRWNAPLSVHQGGLRELLDALRRSVPSPHIIILGIVPANIDRPTMELSPQLSSKFESIVALVVEEVDR